MNTYISINLIVLGKLLKRYKLTAKESNQKIINLANKRYSTWSSLNRLLRKIMVKDANKNKNK